MYVYKFICLFLFIHIQGLQSENAVGRAEKGVGGGGTRMYEMERVANFKKILSVFLVIFQSKICEVSRRSYMSCRNVSFFFF